MGNARDTGYLQNIVTYDANDNIVLPANLNVGGAATFSSSVTASSLIKSGGTSSQFLKADGSVDSSTYLTTGTASSTYLPLAGGTLTGALIGTSATFSGTGYFGGATTASGLTGASELIVQNEIGIQNSDTTGPYLRMVMGGVNQNITLVTGTFSGTEPNLLFSIGGATRLTLASTGAATFNLGSGEMRLNRTGTSEYLKLNTYYLLTDGNDQLLGSVTGATSIYAGNGVSPRVTITSGGNVGIGTLNPESTLEVAGGGIFSLLLSGNLTNATRKFAFIQGRHYTNSEEPIAMIGIDSQASSSTLYIGGGLTSGLNAATEISFQTAANNTTVTGNQKMVITSVGKVGIGVDTPNYSLTVSGTIQCGYIALGDILNNNNSTIEFVNGPNSTTYASTGNIAYYGNTNLTLCYGGGNVLIGTLNNLGFKLNVNGTIKWGSTTNYIASGNDGGGIYMEVVGTTTATRALRIQGINDAGTSYSAIKLRAGESVISFETIDKERMRIAANGEVTFGVTAAYDTSLVWRADFTGTIHGRIYATGAPRVVVVAGESNGVQLTSGATSWTSNSDERLKDINCEIENAVEKLLTLRTVHFSWKSDESNKENLGLIAQDVEKQFPQVIDKGELAIKGKKEQTDKTEYLGIRYTELIPVLVKAIQELQAKLDKNNIN